MIQEKRVDTPTVARIRKALRLRLKDRLPYGFYLTVDEMARLRSAVPMSAMVAFAVIRGAARAAQGEEWVTVRPEVLAAVGRDYRWWHAVTQTLVVAGFIECARHRGRRPRYRVIARRVAVK